MISETLEIRITELVKENPTMDIMVAFDIAFKAEQAFLAEMIEQNTERSIKAKNQICKNVYGMINILK